MGARLDLDFTERFPLDLDALIEAGVVAAAAALDAGLIAIFAGLIGEIGDTAVAEPIMAGKSVPFE